MAFHPSEMTEATLRRLVDNLVGFNKKTPLPPAPKRAQLQEAVAATLGWPNYHAAITELKRAAKQHPHVTPTASAAWRVPVAKMRHTPIDWARDSAGVASLSPQQFAEAVLLQGSEKSRRGLLSALFELNQDKPFCLIQGPMSLPLMLPEGDVLEDDTLEKLLANASVGRIVDVFAALLEPAGDNQLWQGRALSLLTSVLVALVERRAKGMVITPMLISEHLRLDLIQQQAVSKELSKNATQALLAYLRSLPGYKDGVLQQSATTLDQHGFLQMQFTRLLGDMITGDQQAFQHRFGKQSSRLRIQLPQREVSASEESMVQRSVQSWMDRHPGGILVFDVPPAASGLWPWLTMRLPHWLEQGVGVWVGALSEQDIPVASWRTALMLRIPHYLIAEP